MSRPMHKCQTCNKWIPTEHSHCFNCSKPKLVRKIKSPKIKIASREEQHARLIDCGYQNWDDKN